MQYDFTMGQEIVPKAPYEPPTGGQEAALGVERMAEFVAGMMPPEPDPLAPLPEPEYPSYITPEAPSADPGASRAPEGLKTAAIVGAAVVIGYFAYKVLL